MLNNTIISGVASWVPEHVLTNQELSTMVDTSDEWITTRTGIKKTVDWYKSYKQKNYLQFNKF